MPQLPDARRRAARRLAPLLSAAFVLACQREPTANASPAFAALAPDTTAITATVAGVPLFALIDEAAITDSDARARLSAIRSEQTAAAVRVARLAPGADTLLAVGRPVAFDVNAHRRLVFVGTRRGQTHSGMVSWEGALQGGRFGQVNVVLSPAGITAGMQVLPPDGAVYSIRPISGALHAIVYVDQRRLPAD